MSPLVVPVQDGASEFELGVSALGARRVPMAVDYFQRAESAGHDAGECAARRWYCWMLMGDLERAWIESDCIAARDGSDPHRLWDGVPFEGKRVIIRCLHGFGDAIQFIRYARAIRSAAASVTVETHGELVRLFSGLPYIDRVVSWADGSSAGFADWDQQIEVMELSRAFRTTLGSIPADVPYLTIDSEARARSLRHLGGATRKPRVGLIWRSSEWNPARTIPAADFGAIVSAPGFSFFSFQRGPGRAELHTLRQLGEIHDTGDHSPDISDTAADMTNMDLIVTVDTMAAHLAGALGRTVWILLPFEADWRWMLDTCSTPWYPTMTLFRQPRPGDWRTVLELVSARLAASF